MTDAWPYCNIMYYSYNIAHHHFFRPGGAELGGLTTATVTIVKSDYPNGEFGFMGQTELRISNPDELRIISMRIERSAGLLGKQLVSDNLAERASY